MTFTPLGQFGPQAVFGPSGALLAWTAVTITQGGSGHSGTPVTVYTSPSGGTVLASPTTDANGNLTFWAPPGSVDISVNVSGTWYTAANVQVSPPYNAELTGNPMGRIYQNAGQAMSNPSSWNLLTGMTLERVIGGMTYDSTNFGLVVPYSGTYRVSAAVGFQGSALLNGHVGCAIFKLGGTSPQRQWWTPASAVTNDGGANSLLQASGSDLIDCTAGDELQVAGSLSAYVASKTTNGNDSTTFLSVEFVSGY